MKDLDHTFGYCNVYCDGKDCNEEEQIEGFDGHPPQYSDVNNELQKMGWVIKKENGRWVELFSTCSKKQPKIVGDSNKLNERTL